MDNIETPTGIVVNYSRNSRNILIGKNQVLTMNENPDILKIVKEDILRILFERKNRTSLNTIRTEIKVSHPFISQTIKELEKNELIRIKKNHIILTDNGVTEAKVILRKHLAVENYFKKTISKIEAHKKAHIIEHYISEEVIDNIKKLSTFKMEGVQLPDFKLYKDGLISDIKISGSKTFERIVSMGIFPGNKIILTNRFSDKLIIKIKNKKIALGKSLAKKIKVLEYEKS